MSKKTKIILSLIACIAVCFVVCGAIAEIFKAFRINEVTALLLWPIVSGALFYYIYTRKLNEPDSQHYGQSEQEVNSGTIDKGLWAKALVNAKGKEDLRKAEYIKLRAKQLQKES